MGMFKFILFLSISIVHSGDSQSVKVNDDRILQLEQTVSDLQSQNQAQEQKQAAVLSSILSKLSSTTDKLQALEREHNSTLLELTELNNWKIGAEAQLQSRNNCTALPTSVTQKWWHKEIGFQTALLTDPLYTIVGEVLKFDSIQYNAGDGYNSTSGIYVAPASGSYLFWCYIFNYAHQSLYVGLYHNKVRKDCAYADVYAGVASLTHIMHLDDGDSVWFSTIHASTIHGQGYSNFGGTLLHGT